MTMDHPKRLFVSFSGGETSALMTHWCLTRWRNRYDEILVGMANTGEENEATLEFYRDCNRHLGFNCALVEAVVHSEFGAGTTHRVVDFNNASRKGEPFEAVIQKYGIPNQKFPQCTRELKTRPLTSWVRSHGWRPGTYNTAIGIRYDEAHRRSNTAKKARLVYPMLDWRPTSKSDVNEFWSRQPFRLRLMGFEGNCKWCWKKSLRKHLTIMDMNPEHFDFPERMERLYGTVGAEFAKEHIPGYRRTFFRGNMTTSDLRSLYEKKKDTFDRAEDDSVIYNRQMVLFDDEPGDGCTESCEPLWE